MAGRRRGLKGTPEDKRDLEDIKSELSSSAESDTISSHVDIQLSASSAPSSPRSSISAFSLVRHRVDSIENLSIMSTTAQELAPLRKARSCTRGWVTRKLNDINEHQIAGTLNKYIFNKLETSVNQQLTKLEDADMKLELAMDRLNVASDDPIRTQEGDSLAFISESQVKLATFEAYIAQQAAVAAAVPNGAGGSSEAVQRDLIAALGNLPGSRNQSIFKVPFNCPEFDGNSKSKFLFKHWLETVDAIIEAHPNWSGSQKLLLFKSHVKGLAGTLISHLAITNDNYQIARNVLEKHYLDKPYIRDELFKQLLSDRPGYDEDYFKTTQYLAETNNKLLDLKRHYEADLLVENSGGYKLISHIVFSKLSNELKKELISETNTNYPGYNQIQDKCPGVIHKIERTGRRRSEAKPNLPPAITWNPAKASLKESPTPTLNFATPAASHQSQPGIKVSDLHCRFCNIDGHSNLYCAKYKTFADRVARCKAQSICLNCTANHKTEDCFRNNANCDYRPCKFCGQKGHVGAMCKTRPVVAVEKKSTNVNVCLSTGSEYDSPFLLPIISIMVKGPKGFYFRFNALLDTGSSRSYMSSYVLNKLNCNPDSLASIEYDVKTFLGSGRKSLKELTLEVHLPSNRYNNLPVLVDDQFDIDLNVQGLGKCIQNFKKNQLELSANYNLNSDKVHVHGLIGVDIIQFIKELRIINCMHGSAFQVASGIIPFGNTAHFLYPDQLGQSRIESNFNTIISKVTCPTTHINFVLEPKYYYDDPTDCLFEDSLVERGVDRMFNIDSLGIDASLDDVSDYDKSMIDQFEKGIEVRSNQIFVDLVWKDNVNKVPSNHHVALKVLDRVMSSLEASGQQEKYLEVFKQQEAEQIIEKIVVDPKDFHKYIWIPHRPVFKTDEQSSTKIRPVFNCSLKTRNCPSLNEASYGGINIMADMLELLMLFRTNKYTLLGDLRKAFLMIKLKSLRDKNRFCFFIKEGNKLVCYRYTTIIFGFNASPFILNYVLKHFASSFPDDECTKMLNSCFFVDNLVKTSNSIEHLTDLYKTSVCRLAKGNFDLRSCNSNNDDLKSLMKADGRLIEHGCEWDKVLGYLYSSSRDVMKLANFKLSETADTKRSLLSSISKVFDPYGIFAPMIVTGKILFSGVWKEHHPDFRPDDHWDLLVAKETRDAWPKLYNDLLGLSSFEFPRFSLTEEEPLELFLFCDASKRAYGFVAYGVQAGRSCILFAKPKVAPLRDEKSLPTLELLGVFLAYKCLFTLLRTYCNFHIKNVYINCDAQVVLSWILSDSIKTKNQFARNRIKDIHEMQQELSEKFKIPVHLRYVPTDQNPADLLTRGLTLDIFKKNFDFWIHGPEWIRKDIVVWPVSNLSCLSNANKSVMLATIVDGEPEVESEESLIGPLVPFDKFDKYSQLLAVTSIVMRACALFKGLSDEKMIKRWGSTDYLHCSRVHLLQVMQQLCFPNELEYLKDSRNKRVPDLVNNLNLYIDKNHLLRSDGRIGKTRYFEDDIINPILLAKEHPLSSKIVEDCHRRCKHLGIQATLNLLRLSGFWIPRPYQSIKKILASCSICKKFNSLAFNYPRVTNLPKHRVDLIRPYKHTGLDYTGHVFIRNSGKDVKMYLLIFTCLSIRAIHIELVPDMTANQFVLALVRFVNLYGIPTHIYSDNDRSIIAGVNLVSQVFASSEFKEKFDKFNIKHIRIPLYSPWVGATWERMIKTLKCCLAKTLLRVVPSYFRLLTILSDIQLAINSRPLTYRCAQDASLEIISPNVFIRPYANSNLIFRDVEQSLCGKPSPSRVEILDSIQIRDELFNDFRKVWYDTYLLGMRQLYKDLHEVKFENKIRIDEVVLIKDTKKKRQHWLLGRVVELLPGSDGKVRAVRLWRGDRVYAVHSLKHLYPVELAVTHSHIAKGGTLPEVDEGGGLEVAPGSSGVIPDMDLEESDSDESVGEDPLGISDGGFDTVEAPSSVQQLVGAGEPSATGRPKRSDSARRRPFSNDFVYY